jgi:putative transposase
MTESFIKTFKRDYVSLNDVPDTVMVMEKLPSRFEVATRIISTRGLR